MQRQQYRSFPLVLKQVLPFSLFPLFPLLPLLFLFCAPLLSAQAAQESDNRPTEATQDTQDAQQIRLESPPASEEPASEEPVSEEPLRPPLSETRTSVSPEVFLQGYQAFQKKDWSAAVTAFAQALQQEETILTDYSRYYLALAHLNAGRSAEAGSALQSLLRDYPTTVWQSEAALVLANLAFAQNKWQQVIHTATQALQAALATDATRNTARLLIAQAVQRLGHVDKAYARYQELRSTLPRSTIGQTAKENVEKLRVSHPHRFGLKTDRAYYNEVKLLLKEGDVPKAEALAEQFNTQFSNSSLRPAALLLLAGIYKSQGRADAAQAHWQQIVERYPKTSSAPRALYRWARFFWNRDQDKKALPLFERLTQVYPHHALAAEAWYAIGRIFQDRQDQQDQQDQQDHARAASAYQYITQHFSRGSLVREAHWRLGWMAYQRGDYEHARKVLRTLARSAPGTAEGGSALYWQARAADRAGQLEEAKQGYRRLLRRYPYGYYALWAEKRLGITPAALTIHTLPPRQPPPLSAAQAPHYQRCTVLAELGLFDLARRELDWIRQKAPKGATWTHFLLSEYRRLNGHTTAFQLARTLQVGSQLKQAYFYPQAYWGLVSTQAQQHDLDPYLIVSLIRQESLFNPTAVSPANAYGLMQLLPTTAAGLTSLPLNGVSPLTDPELNISLGSTYLRQLLDRYNDSVILALGAYNAGERAADKWKTRSGELEPDEFIESISYRETRKYVKLVLRNYRTYVRLYGNGKTTLNISLP